MANKEQKVKRNTELRRYAQEHPDATLAELGSIYGLRWRQGVWRILHPDEYNEARKARRQKALLTELKV